MGGDEREVGVFEKAVPCEGSLRTWPRGSLMGVFMGFNIWVLYTYDNGASFVARYILTFTTPGGNYVYDREVNSLLSVSDEEFVSH